MHNWTICVGVSHVIGTISMRSYSAGRMWVVLPAPALLPRFWPGAGVRSEAWVPA
jgi:hypothetical protein